MAAALIALVVPGTAAPQFGNLVVDTTADGNDGECAGDCTLREAIALADSQQGQWVSIPPGVYRLNASLGPLVLQTDIVFGVSFAGNNSAGARTTVIDARGAVRAVQVQPGASAVLAGVTIIGGSADAGGAALVPENAQLTIYDSILKDNVAAGRGGAIANAGSLSVWGSTLEGNRAASGGAIASQPGGNTFVYLSTLSGNRASSSGGAIAASGSVQVQRTTIANNTAPAGGGIFDEGGALQGMWGTLLAGNSGACGGATTSRPLWSSNLSDDTSCAFEGAQGTYSASPQIGGLANNGGPTDTHALRAGSPAINAVDPSFCIQGTPDQRHAPAPDTCDIGAYEFGAQVPQSELPPPQAGETVNVFEARGRVRVRIPGSDEFFELEDAQQVPVGSTFDTSRGRVTLQAAGSQRAWFYQGVFRLGQGKGAKPLSTLSLSGRLSCGRGANVAQRRTRKRRLWGDGSGRFRTKGRHSAATVVGTRWLVEDRCNGTLTRVTKGRVRVRDFRARRTVVVKAGRRYFARAR